MSRAFRATAGYIFTVLFTIIVFSYGLGFLTPLSAYFAGTIFWLFLFTWKNLGGGNPVLNRINYLRNQIEYAQEDIAELTNQRVPGYKAETRYLNQKIKEYKREIKELQ
jgi:hypothetical protein